MTRIVAVIAGLAFVAMLVLGVLDALAGRAGRNVPLAVAASVFALSWVLLLVQPWGWAA